METYRNIPKYYAIDLETIFWCSSILVQLIARPKLISLDFLVCNLCITLCDFECK